MKDTCIYMVENGKCGPTGEECIKDCDGRCSEEYFNEFNEGSDPSEQG